MAPRRHAHVAARETDFSQRKYARGCHGVQTSAEDVSFGDHSDVPPPLSMPFFEYAVTPMFTVTEEV